MFSRSAHTDVGPGLAILTAFCLAALFLAWVSPARGATSRPQIIVYYANETVTAIDETHEQRALLALLRHSPTRQAKHLVDDLSNDARLFSALAEREMKALLAAAERLSLDVLIFTNKLALEGKALIYRARTGGAFEIAVDFETRHANRFLALAPLARPENLRRALLTAAGQGPYGADIVFITNSHGSADMALMPRVNLDWSKVDPAEFLARLERPGTASSARWSTPLGTHKPEFWEILADVAAATGARFPLIARIACQSGIASWSEFRALPASVDLVAHTGQSSPQLGSIDLSRTLESLIKASEAPPLDKVVQDAGLLVDDRNWLALRLVPVLLSQIPLAVYFLPLAIWAVWMVAPAVIRSATGAGRMVRGGH